MVNTCEFHIVGHLYEATIHGGYQKVFENLSLEAFNAHYADKKTRSGSSRYQLRKQQERECMHADNIPF